MNSEKKTILRDYYPSGKIRLESELGKNGIPDGLCKIYFENGQLEELSSRREGRMDGHFEQWTEDGRLLGKFDLVGGTGIHTHWWPNGRVGVETEYKGGVKHGHSKTYEVDSGRCVLTVYFWEGKKVSRKQFESLKRYDRE